MAMKKVNVLLFILVTTHSILQAQTNQEILLSINNFIKIYPNTNISNRAWKTPNNSKLWDNLIITQELEHSTASYDLKGYNRNVNNGSWDGILLRYDPKEGQRYIHIRDAKQIYNDVLNVFGQPNRIVDYGFLAESQYRQDFICQWDKNNYSIQLQSVDIGYILGNPGIIAITIEIRKNGSFKNVAPLVGIRIKAISGRFFLSSRNSWHPLNDSDVAKYVPMEFILDYNNEKVLIPNYQERGDIIDISDLQATLLFYDNQKNITMKIVLNRYTGSTETTLYENSRANVIVNGIAENIELNFRPRF